MNKPLGFKDKIWFGTKYHKQTVQDVLEKDPNYIIWAINKEVTVFSQEVLDWLDKNY